MARVPLFVLPELPPLQIRSLHAAKRTKQHGLQRGVGGWCTSGQRGSRNPKVRRRSERRSRGDVASRICKSSPDHDPRFPGFVWSLPASPRCSFRFLNVDFLWQRYCQGKFRFGIEIERVVRESYLDVVVHSGLARRHSAGPSQGELTPLAHRHPGTVCGFGGVRAESWEGASAAWSS